MKASCKNCVLCIPSMDVSGQSSFVFPDETECGAGYESYPDAGHQCPHYIYDDTNEYEEYIPVWRYGI